MMTIVYPSGMVYLLVHVFILILAVLLFTISMKSASY